MSEEQNQQQQPPTASSAEENANTTTAVPIDDDNNNNNNQQQQDPSNIEPPTMSPQEKEEEQDKSKKEEKPDAGFDPNDSDDERNEKKQKMKELGITEIHQIATLDEVVREFLLELRSLRIMGCLLTPKVIFALTLFAFFLPSLWGVSSVLIEQDLPSRVFYDRCRNGTGEIFDGKPVVEYPFEVCAQCANNQPYVYTNSSTVSRNSQFGFAAAVVAVNCVVTFIATTFFVRLAIKEFTSTYLLSYDILVEAPIDMRAVCILIVTILLCMTAAAVNVAYSFFLRLRLENLPLGYKQFENSTVGTCFAGNITEGLFAVFDPDNASANSGLSVNDPIAVTAAVLAAFLLYIPMLLRLVSLVTSHFNTLNVKDLMQNSRITARIFKELQYSVDYGDLMKAIEDYAETQDPEDCSCAVLVTRLFGCACNCADPPAIFFGFSWGQEESDVNFVLTLLQKRGQLKPYNDEELSAELKNLQELHVTDGVDAAEEQNLVSHEGEKDADEKKAQTNPLEKDPKKDDEEK